MANDHAAAVQTCDNCGTVLQGAYCHVCGQHGHNPLHSFRHAIEDVFESFWHLDGRVFRTLRDLFVPGRVAAHYLAGRRASHIPPLRMFIILSVVTFFVGKLTLHLGPDDIRLDAPPRAGETVRVQNNADGDGRFAKATTIEQVAAIRATALGELETARRDPAGKFFMAAVGNLAAREIEDAAAQRLKALGATPEQIRRIQAQAPTATSTPGPRPADAAGASPAKAAPVRTVPAKAAPAKAGGDTRDAPFKLTILPVEEDDGLFSRWLQERIKRIEANSALIEKDPDLMIRLFLGALPGALLLLMPVFALLLKLAYVRSGRGYLEHLVVALYSHAYLLLSLLGIFLLIGLAGAGWMPGWATAAASMGAVLVGLHLPFHLLWMQKRVYGQGWFKTLVKYTMLGSLYSVLLTFGIIYAIFAGLSS